jgi:hypothetical protein
MRHLLFGFLVFVSTFLVVGCGGSISPPATRAVSGSVFYKGKPAAQVSVTFHPQFALEHFKPVGTTDAKGKFTLSTGAPNNGAPRGAYVVTFEKLTAGSDKRGLDIDIDLWKGKYADPKTSKFKVEINDNVELEAFKLD